MLFYNFLQNFAKALLDVADNLGRASSVVKENFLKIDPSNDTAGAVPLLKSLLEGVEMTEKQLGEVKFYYCFPSHVSASLPPEHLYEPGCYGLMFIHLFLGNR